nr:NPCBM/NEW2 domain-containing protein [Deinococcus humi]
MVLLTGLLIGCGPSDPPNSEPIDPEPNPYAGGVTHPWTGTDQSGNKPIKSGENFLSDLGYTSARNVWGPIELDRSNGNEKAGDGQALKIGTQSFTKGIGVHANSELTYALNDSCSTFSATVGIDAEVGAKGSVIFQVFGDGKQLFDSGKLTGTSAAKPFSVSVAGVNELKLVVTDAGDGIEYDHADWANAKLTCQLSQVALESRDGGPFADRMVFNRIGSLASPPPNGVHDRATVRVKNTGSSPLRVTDLPITGPWQLDPKPTFPVTIAPGGFLDVRLRFVAQSLSAQGGKFHTGTVNVVTNAQTAAGQTIQLAGLWQSESENNQEPYLEDIVQTAFGFKTAFAPSKNNNASNGINQKGKVTPQGDEVIAPYWQRADSSKPVAVQQLAAYHTQGDRAVLRWFTKGITDSNTILAQKGVDAQSVLPRKDGSEELAAATFTPSAQTFGFRVDSESSDPVLNNQTKDRNNGCVDPCGQHVRFFKAKDQSGQIMPDTYLLIMDYSGINYDYNDNIYLVSNLKPAPILINVGLAGNGVNTTDPAGNVWVSDRDRNGYALFTPTTAKNEPDSGPNASLDILKTDFDALYRSYRGNVGSVPQAERQISFNIPLENGPHTLKLHFADLAHTVADKRIFDVTVEGQKVLSNLDIVKEAGGGNTALVKTLTPNVTGGVLNLNLSASVDYPSIAGIEILR